MQIVEEHNYDGIVFDTPFNTFNKQQSILSSFLVQFVNMLSELLQRKGKTLFYNIAHPMNKDWDF